MNYAISILTKKIKEHQQRISDLQGVTEIEFQAEQIFIDNDIENHQLHINELQEAIKLLL